MANYDGPSYFKKNHPKLKKIQPVQQKEKETSKYTLPRNIQTRENTQKIARQYMKTPSRRVSYDLPPERFPFKRTQTPSSLQKLDGWTKQHVDVELYTKIQTRLQKDEDTFLLFEDHLSDKMKKKLDVKKPVPRHIPKVEEEQVTLMRKGKGIPQALLKSGTGLHRSLSNIMADEQKTIHKNKNSLNHLFDQNQINKKDKKS